MTVGIQGNDKDTLNFISLCESLSVKEQDYTVFLKHGFTNAYKPVIYYCKRISKKNNVPITFNLSINKKTMTIKDIDLLDEYVLQPTRCSKKELDTATQIIYELINKNLLQKN